MADSYTGSPVPPEYSQSWLAEEFRRISAAVSLVENDVIIIRPLHAAPSKLAEGMVANADGTDWNPGAGAGLYEYVGGAWSKL